MDKDPVFYKKFSQLLKDTIEAYEKGRIDEAEYLKRTTELMDKILSHTDSEIPASLQNNNAGRSYYGLCFENYKELVKQKQEVDIKKISLDTAIAIDSIVRNNIVDGDNVVIDWQNNKGKLIGRIKLEIEDYLIDEVKRKYDIAITFEDMDRIVDSCIDVAKQWFK